MTHPHPKRSFVPQAVITRTGKINTAGANVNTASASINTVNRPINIVASTPIIQVYNGLDPQKSLILLLYVHGNPQQKEYKEKIVIDSGCSRHMIRNKCYLDEYEDYDGGFVSFGDGKGRISGKGNQTNGIAGTKDNIVAGPKDSEGDAGMKPIKVDERGASDKNEKDAQDTRSESERLNQREMQTEHTNSINTYSTLVSTAGPSVSTANAFEEHLFE
ncbi:hypothetical protein Tco_0846636 [Tanacetum coccineum]